MQKPETNPRKKMQKLFWDFKTQTDYLISAKADLVIVKEKRKLAA